MKYIGLIVLILLVGCTQLMNGEVQPVVMKKQNIYYTTCGGAVENWASCNTKAMATCAKGYDVLNKSEDSNGLRRELTFQCRVN